MNYSSMIDAVSGTTIASAMLFVAAIMVLPLLAIAGVRWISEQVIGSNNNSDDYDDDGYYQYHYGSAYEEDYGQWDYDRSSPL